MKTSATCASNDEFVVWRSISDTRVKGFTHESGGTACPCSVVFYLPCGSLEAIRIAYLIYARAIGAVAWRRATRDCRSS